jgi:protein-S-isoprenylcysteine O-methyltransferase Ste14
MTKVTADFGLAPLTGDARETYSARHPTSKLQREFVEMSLSAFISIAWAAFGAYWLISALGAKESSFSGRRRVPVVFAGAAFVLLRVFRTGDLAVHSPVLQLAGIIALVSGLGLAVWARVHLGRNWGMPMTRKVDPELVTSGPYRFVRRS